LVQEEPGRKLMQISRGRTFPLQTVFEKYEQKDRRWGRTGTVTMEAPQSEESTNLYKNGTAHWLIERVPCI